MSVLARTCQKLYALVCAFIIDVLNSWLPLRLVDWVTQRITVCVDDSYLVTVDVYCRRTLDAWSGKLDRVGVRFGAKPDVTN